MRVTVNIGALRRNRWYEYMVRFTAGGAVTVVAGLFSAAPSVALASLGLAVSKHGHSYAAQEGTAMIAGAAAFVLYAWVVCHLLFRYNPGVPITTTATIALWLGTALGLWYVAG